MPVTVCLLNGKPGYKWGASGKCYTYSPGQEGTRKRAKRKAAIQGYAAHQSGYRGDAVAVAVQLRQAKQEHLMRRIRIRKPPKMIVPRTIEYAYQQQLLQFVDEWRRQYMQIVDPQLELLALDAYANRPEASSNIKGDALHSDSWVTDFTRIMGTLEIAIDRTVPRVQDVSLNIAEETTRWNQRQWRKTVRSIVGVDIFTREPWLNEQIESFTRENVTLLKKLARETKEDIEGIVNRGFRAGKRISSIRKEILDGTKLAAGRFKKTRTRAELIARDQVNKLNGQLTELRQTELGLSQYYFETASDERVRSSHAAMNGKLCRWDDATVYKNGPEDKRWKQRSSIGGIEKHPGEDYQCRCYAAADFSTIVEGNF